MLLMSIIGIGKIFKKIILAFFLVYQVLVHFNFRTEKNACAWSQDKIKELFTNKLIEGDGCK